MSAIDPLVRASESYSAVYPVGLPTPPARQVAILTCMDSRLLPSRFLGVIEGEAHIIRNAGGVVTDDVVRSLTMSQRLLGTRAIAVIQHTRCGMADLVDEDFRSGLAAETGRQPPWSSPMFDNDLAVSVEHAVEQLRQDPLLPHRDDIRGFVFDVDDGTLTEIGAG